MLTSPLPSLGSNKPAEGWRVVGGKVWPKDEVLKMTTEERKSCIQQLPEYLIATLPVCAVQEVSTRESWLQKHGFAPLSGVALARALVKVADDREIRVLFLRAMAGGLLPKSADARKYFAYGRGSILQIGPEMIDRSIKFGAPEKLQRWAEEGG